MRIFVVAGGFVFGWLLRRMHDRKTEEIEEGLKPIHRLSDTETDRTFLRKS